MPDPPQIHFTPPVDSDAPMHELSDRCPCHPLNEFVPNPVTAGRNDWLVTHRPLLADPKETRP